MLLHVSTFKMSSSGSSLCLTKITCRYLGLGKIKLLKYKVINFNKMLIVQRDKRFAQREYMQVSARCQQTPGRHGHISSACTYSHYANLLSRCTINILLKFIILYFNNVILLRPRYLYVILVRHNELPEDDILNVET